jgi:RNA polymerase sigma-70 factor, Bacteroides expansion family 1
MSPERELKCIKALGRGDHGAFDLLFTEYHSRVIHFLYDFVKDKEQAKDMAQELFFKVWKNREYLSKVDSFKSYLFRMARNMIYDYYDHTLIKEKYYDQQQKEEKYIYSDIVEEEFYAKELSLLIDLVVELMPKQRKQVFKLSRDAGLTNEEIAERLSISKRTVESHISNVLQFLRRAIADIKCFFF